MSVQVIDKYTGKKVIIDESQAKAQKNRYKIVAYCLAV